MDINNYAPIAVFAYNRPHYLRQTLEALASNIGADQSHLHIFCDGAKNGAVSEELNLIEEVRQIANEKKWCKEVCVYESPSNKGLGKAIVEGVSLIVNKYQRVIVLEDDLVTSPYFLKFMNDGLYHYQHDKRVLSIVGWTYPVPELKSYPCETYFMNSADCLGWATWKRGWDLYEVDSNKLMSFFNRHHICRFNFDNNYNFFGLLKRTAEGSSNSWAIKWYACAFIHKKVSLYPAKSLVRHIGVEGVNVKVDNRDFLGWEINEEKTITQFESLVEESTLLRLGLTSHFRKYNRRRISINSLQYAFKRLILYNFKKIIKK